MGVRWSALLSTQEFRTHLVLITVVQLFLFSTILIFTFFYINLIEKATDEQFYGVIGRLDLSRENPETEVAAVLTKGAKEGDIDRGREILKAYGWESSLKTFQKPYMNRVKPFLYIGFPLLLLLILITNISLYYHQQKASFNKIETLTSIIGKNLEGKSVFCRESNKEGIWSVLADSFNKMIKVLQNTAEVHKQDKIFLKDTLSGISHQLKTPMSSLIMYNDLMLEDPEMEDARRNDFLTQSSSQLLRMEWLIKSLLKITRLEAGTISYRSVSVQPVSQIEKVYKELESLAGSRILLIETKEAELKEIQTDPDWLREAISNIVKNSIQHTGPSGIISTSFVQTPLYTRFIIEDDGEGIPEKDLPRIFERFFKGSSSTSMESVGIGLSLSEMIIKDQGGEIRAENRAEKGSRFIITLPY